MPTRRSRLSIFLVIVVVALGALFGVRTLWRTAQHHFSDPHCSFAQYDIDTEQAAVAATMVGAVAKYHPASPFRAAVLALAAGLQESKLRNLAPGEGDRDSVGVLQQRPSQGWGGHDPATLTDVTEATREFLAALVKVKHWQSLPLAEAIQDVQISADGSAYAKHEDEASALATALQGRTAAAITCTFDKPTVVASSSTVVSQLVHQLPVQQPAVSARTIRVSGASWQTAAWFVANADRLGIESVSYSGRRWSRSDGWKKMTSSTSAVVATMATL